MNRVVFVLPLFALFAYCSSTKNAATPAGPGISNVNVSRNDTMTSAAKAGASFTTADRDWSYTAKNDTTLNGTWTLDSIQGNDGNWTSTSTWYKDSTAMTTDTAILVSSDSASNTMATEAKASKKSKIKAKNRKALYDSAQVRLRRSYRDSTVRDTSIAEYQYWHRIPTVTFNAISKVFTGNTGCNSMSGSFNFSDKDIQFGRNIVTTKMMCNEYNEDTFISALKKADNYQLKGNTLELKQGETLLLTFRRS